MEFTVCTDEDVRFLWNEGHTDDSWPHRIATEEAFSQFAQGYQVAETLHEGAMRTIRLEGSVIGYTVVHQIPQHYVPDSTLVCECGTYLLPLWRGRDINPLVKAWMLKVAFHEYESQWCIFVIPKQNVRAIRGLDKLGWPMVRETERTSGLFSKYRKRKSWEMGEPVIVYAVERSMLETAHLE
jgi:RimJ/RimL family protein N-acetyltransferase